MATTEIQIITCDGCGKSIDEMEVLFNDRFRCKGTKIVTGCLGPYPPSALFHYCPTCKMPDKMELAKSKPWHVIQEVLELGLGGFITMWSGRIHYNPDLEAFTDGYGDEPLL